MAKISSCISEKNRGCWRGKLIMKDWQRRSSVNENTTRRLSISKIFKLGCIQLEQVS